MSDKEETKEFQVTINDAAQTTIITDAPPAAEAADTVPAAKGGKK